MNVGSTGDCVELGPGFFRRMSDGETWAWHPTGGIAICHPERKPLWCGLRKGCYVQEWIEFDFSPAVPQESRKLL